jgi:hypothetical protein
LHPPIIRTSPLKSRMSYKRRLLNGGFNFCASQSGHCDSSTKIRLTIFNS